MSQPLDTSPVPTGSSGIGLNLLTIAAAVMIVGALLLVLNARNLLSGYNNWRAEQVAKKAMELIEDQRFEAASQLVLNALRRAPEQPDLMRATAELFVRAYDDPQSALNFQRRVAAGSQSTAADQRRLAEILLLTGDTSAAMDLYEALPGDERESRRGMELLAGIRRAQGQIDEAVRILRQAWQRPPQDAEARLQLARLDEAQAFESAQASAGHVIWEIARLNDPAALTAIEHLCLSSQLTAGQAKELKVLVENHPRANERLRYTMLRAYLRLHIMDRNEVMASEEQRNASRAPEERFEFLRWLGLEGEHDRILRLLPQQAITRDADLFLLYVDALSAAGEWRSLLSLVQTGKPPITQPAALVIQARCHAQLSPDMIEARKHLRRAYDLCSSSDIGVILRAADAAEQHHLNDLAIEGYRRVAKARPAQRLRLLDKVVALLRLEQDLLGMMSTLKELLALRPGSQSYADQLNYLRLVSGQEMETAGDEVLGFQKPAAENHAPSAALPAGLLRALAAWRFGHEDTLRLALESLANPERLSPGPRAVLASLYALTGREVEGFRLAEKIAPLTLLECETPFLKLSLR